jgi:peroxiredoxin Q/BCP
MTHLLAAGDAAPDFTLPDADGAAVTLSATTGRWRVVYFYPKASTPGCTTQACSIRDHAADYARRGVVVFGISPDPVKRVKGFHVKQELNFTLLADEDHAVCEQYGTWQEKSMYGKTYWGATRSTFLISPSGEIAAVIAKASPKTHDAVVLEALDALIAAA